MSMQNEYVPFFFFSSTGTGIAFTWVVLSNIRTATLREMLGYDTGYTSIRVGHS